jgi:dTDP-4-dehydrorhamnose reductase
MKLLILGAQGMLGQMAHRYFCGKAGFTVAVLNTRYQVQNHIQFIEHVNSYRADVVLNCIGLIKQRCPAPKDLYDVNARLPGHLAAGLRPDTVLVHPSTDCIFKGTHAGMYGATQAPDAEDDYGISKSMGELAVALRPKTMLIRASIIGPDARPDGLGLMAWFMKHPRGARINGYTNHLWNGITTLQWCKLVASLLEEAREYGHARIVQPGLNKPVSKYELLCTINRIFDCGLEVCPHQDAHYVNRSLLPSLVASPIEQQLQEIAAI